MNALMKILFLFCSIVLFVIAAAILYYYLKLYKKCVIKGNTTTSTVLLFAGLPGLMYMCISFCVFVRASFKYGSDVVEGFNKLYSGFLEKIFYVLSPEQMYSDTYNLFIVVVGVIMPFVLATISVFCFIGLDQLSKGQNKSTRSLQK